MELSWQKTPPPEFSSLLVGAEDHIGDFSEETSLERHDTLKDMENAKTYLVSGDCRYWCVSA
jgi:hypothetical protein